MNRSSNKESPNVSISSPNGGRVSNLYSSLMNENGQFVYRRSPVQNQHQQQVSANSIHQHQQTQPQSFDTLGSPSTTTSYNSEEINSENINSFEEEESINDLRQKFDYLQRQIEALNETQTTQDERYKRSRQENDALLTRIHSLEDQIRELELTSEARAKEDERRHKEAMAKQMKVQSAECEQHLHANFLLQQELFKSKNDLLKSEALIKALRCEKETLELELQEKNSELISLDEEIHKLKLLVKNLKDEENVKSNLISILNEELEDSHNRSQKAQHISGSNNSNIDNDQLNASSSQNNFNPHSSSPKLRSSSSRRSSVTSGIGEDFFSSNAAAVNSKALRDIDGLETSLIKLRDENSKLKETNEELQAQLLNFQLEEGRSLVQEGNKSYSLADELGDIDVQRVMKALKEQQDDNARLREYMDKVLLKILEKNPEILDRTVSSQDDSKNNGKQQAATEQTSPCTSLT